jgi:hypothetical protein
MPLPDADRSGPPGVLMATTFALLPCTKSKLAWASPAWAMYQPSPLFSGLWRVALASAYEPLILSAKYGLLRPDDVIDPYDETLKGRSRSFRAAWAASVLHDLRRHLPPAARIVSYLSVDYAEFLVPALRADGHPVEEPLLGLRNGKRLAWCRLRLQMSLPLTSDCPPFES